MRSRMALAGIIALALFVLYWQTSFILAASLRTSYFGADSVLYTGLATGDLHDHVLLFHPVTGVLALAWMTLVSPFSGLMSPADLINGMYAAVGAGGVLAAMWAFSAIVPRPYVLLWSLIYALSLSIWYFSAINESKIITGSLSTLYIAAYLHLRERWSMRGAVLLTVTLTIACLNEIVSGLLAVIPAIDVLLRRGLKWSELRWIVLHGLPVPASLLVMELLIKLAFVGYNSTEAAGTDHFSLFLTYVAMADHGLSSMVGYVLNWFAFSIAAPTPYTTHTYALWPDYQGYFEPSLRPYLYHWSTGALVLAVVGTVALAAEAGRSPLAHSARCLIAALIVYSLLRGFVFFLFIPPEALLYSSAVMLPHLMIAAMLLATSAFPYQRSALVVILLLVTLANMRFMQLIVI